MYLNVVLLAPKQVSPIKHKSSIAIFFFFFRLLVTRAVYRNRLITHATDDSINGFAKAKRKKKRKNVRVSRRGMKEYSAVEAHGSQYEDIKEKKHE